MAADCKELLFEKLRNLIVDSDLKKDFIKFKCSLEYIKENIKKETAILLGSAEWRRAVTECVLQLPAHCVQHYWTTADTRALARGTLSKLLAVCECEREVELLVGKAECLKYKLSHDNHVTPSDEESAHCGAIVKDLFQVFKVKLTQTNWKSNPSYKHSLVWCVNNLPHPHMEPHLQNVLPPLLMFVDDYEVYNKKLGLIYLTRLIDNVNATELRQYGHGMVIYDAIHQLIYSNEVEILNTVHPCLLRLLPVIEGPPPLVITEPRPRTIRNKVFDDILRSLQMESKTPQRQAMTRHLESYIYLLGVWVLRHSEQLFPVLFDCMEFADCSGELTRVHCLKALEAVIAVAWLRIHPRQVAISKCLLKLAIKCCHGDKGELPDDSTPEFQVIEHVITCFVRLHEATNALQAYMNTLEEQCHHKGLHYIITKWRQRTSLN